MPNPKKDAATAEAPEGTATEAAAEKKEPRPDTEFVALVRPSGQAEWQQLPQTFTGKTQQDAKREVAHALNEVEEWKAHIQGEGLEIVVTSARSFKPVVVKVEPQPSKVVIR